MVNLFKADLVSFTVNRSSFFGNRSIMLFFTCSKAVSIILGFGGTYSSNQLTNLLNLYFAYFLTVAILSAAYCFTRYIFFTGLDVSTGTLITGTGSFKGFSKSLS